MNRRARTTADANAAYDGPADARNDAHATSATTPTAATASNPDHARPKGSSSADTVTNATTNRFAATRPKGASASAPAASVGPQYDAAAIAKKLLPCCLFIVILPFLPSLLILLPG